MSIADQLARLSIEVTPPTDAQLAARADDHARLRVTDDYLEVLRTGILDLDLANDLPLSKTGKDAVPYWVSDVSYVGRASDPEDFVEPMSSLFYEVGATYGGSMVVQISRGRHRGKLAIVEDSALGAFEYASEYLPTEPVQDDATADRILDTLGEHDLLGILDLDLRAFLALRLQHVRMPAPPVPMWSAAAEEALDGPSLLGAAKAPADWDAVATWLGLDPATLVEHTPRFHERAGLRDRLVFVVPGDVTLEGDVSTRHLRVDHPDMPGAVDPVVIVVLGDLTVTGHLEVEPATHVGVRGTVRAGQLTCRAANLLSGTRIEADWILWEDTHVEGILSAPVIQTPHLLRSGELLGDDGPLTGRCIRLPEHPLLAAAAGHLDRRPATEAVVAEQLRAGRLDEILVRWDALQQDTLEDLPDDPVVPILQPTMKDANRAFPSRHLFAARGYLAGITVQGDEVFLAGGGGVNIAFRSRDGGRTFASFGEDIPILTGVRHFLRYGDTLFACGQYGVVLRSDDDGATFTRVAGDFGNKCLQTLMHADGRLWVTGDGGAFTSPDGVTWSRVDVAGEITRPRATSFGAVLPSDQGLLYRSDEGRIAQTTLRAPAALWAATETATGALIAVGDQGGVYRSTNGGATFQTVDVGVSSSLENVACAADGTVLAGGRPGLLLRSTDDGRSFTRVPQPFIDDWVFGIAPWRDRFLVCGSGATLLAVR
jgi:photosystem II stability/assembly factor-like uncharacterized protein